ncbi:peptidylprolyl isomerase [Colwellia sp. MEBiC06753]
MKLPKLLSIILSGAALWASSSQATIVEFVTSQGNVRVNLHDSTTPKTVENFLNYVNEGAYQDTVIHRAEKNFVIQGGGFKYDYGFSHIAVETNDPVVNEPKLSNVKGTIAMAKVAGDQNSATNQWFFNMTDNSANLDLQNGGFTVFGQVVAEDMPVLAAMEELTHCVNSYGRTPMVNFTGEQCSNGDIPGYENFVVIYSINIVDSNQVTDSDLTKTPNTLINEPIEKEKSSSGGGSTYWLTFLALAGLLRRKFA